MERTSGNRRHVDKSNYQGDEKNEIGNTTLKH